MASGKKEGHLEDRVSETTDDLIMFARHARRTKVQSSDVLLLGRRNAGVESVLRSYMDTDGKPAELKEPQGGSDDEHH
ncbi:MHF histone-fold complex component [Emydomyces testavorans]|uniref:MHF histone-fold complex component n=1 Tax=Emydomyces testavorans TaxID=2070801 RepID=A0AAF0DI37_9EURO|nr:MHF histone-fold complex component [Emydomyces testavorans]